MQKTCSFLPLAVLLLFSCASSSGIIQKIPADISGIVHAGQTNTAEEYAYLDYLGISWKLHTFYWSRIEPQKGVWNFDQYDSFVDNGRNSGIKTIGILAYDNNWIHADNERHYYIPPENLPDFLEYVRNTVDHFKGRVDAWCIWNEPNSHFWNGTKGEFYELSRRTAEAIRQTDSDAIILAGAFNRGVFGLPKEYIRGLFESGAMENADAIAFHLYELNPVRTSRLYDSFRKITFDYGFEEKIWVTETGYPSGGFYPTRVSERNFPAYVIKTFTLLAARGSRKIIWYQLFDPQTRNNSNSEDFFGLVRSDRNYNSKGSEAFRLCASYLPDTICYTQISWLDYLPASVSAHYFEGNSHSVLILWNNGPGTKRVHLTLPEGTGYLSHDPVSGNARALPQESIVRTGSMPVFITWQVQDIQALY